MSERHTAIQVRNLGKKYRLGGPQETHRTFREAIANSVKAPFRRLSSHEPPREFWALKHISFDVGQGEVLGIIGRNGAGKSTLLKIVSRITSPTEGTVDLYGHVGSLLEVGTGFHQELTGLENIYLSGSILGMKQREIDARLDEIVKFSEIEQFLDTPVKRYSSGMYVRLAFAVAAHLKTDILMIDEVLAVGDAAFQKKCLGKMGSITNEGKTILFVSHNMAAIQKLCPTGILIDQGHTIAQGEISKIITEYLQLGSGDNLLWEKNDNALKKAYFKKIYFCDDQGKKIAEISPVGSVYLIVEFVIEKNIEDLQIAFHISNKYGDPIFSSSPEDTNEKTPHEKGIYSARIKIPNELLLTQNYSLTFSLYVPQTKSIDLITPLQFTVREINCWSNRTPGGRVGVLAVPCEWEIYKE